MTNRWRHPSTNLQKICNIMAGMMSPLICHFWFSIFVLENPRALSHLATMTCFFMSSRANSYIDDNATHLWRHGYNVKNLWHCRQMRMALKFKKWLALQSVFWIESRLCSGRESVKLSIFLSKRFFFYFVSFWWGVGKSKINVWLLSSF